MKINSNTKVEASKSDSRGQAITTKISILNKPIITKAFSSLVLILSILIVPVQAHAGLFSFIGDIFGSRTMTADETADYVVHNSQTIQLMEPSLTSELKPSSNIADVTIVGDEALESKTGPMGTEADVKGYSSSDSRIGVYTVKAGDTLDSIARANKVSKIAIIYANSDIKRSELTKAGQTLVIIPLSGFMYTVKKGETAESISKKYGISVANILEYNVMSKSAEVKPGLSIILVGLDAKAIAKADKKALSNTDKPIVQKPEVAKVPEPEQYNAPEVEEKAPSVNQAPSGSAVGGYIWPLPEGAGRISQGLHDDNAVDIAAPKGTPIYSIKDGTVLIADGVGYNGGYGQYVVVNFNDGSQALFGHMSKVIAVSGQAVKQGDLIGLVGTTGSSTGNHVHLSMRGGFKNPYAKLKKGSTSYSFNN